MTERDRFRAFEYLTRRTKELHDPGPLLEPLLSLLAFRGLDQRTTDDVLRLLLRCHPGIDQWAVPQLISMLRTENADTRTRVNDALLAFRALVTGNDVPSDDFARKWKPSEGDLPADIESHVEAWQRWWKVQPPTAKQAAPATPVASGEISKAN